jgi:hypothetical protein
MRRLGLLLGILCLLDGSGAWGAKQKYDPYQIPREQFRSSIKTIALKGVTLPDGLSDLSHPDEVRAIFDSLITAELKRSGFGVVPPQEFDQLWEQGADSLGGLFDTVTGKPDTTKTKALRGAVRHALKERFNADAVLHPGIRVVVASFNGATAVWDGVKQTMSKGLMGRLAVSNASGRVRALSLVVFIDGEDDKDLYIDSGGLSVMAKVGAGGKFVDFPVDSLFSNPERNAKAVRVALEGLAEKQE